MAVPTSIEYLPPALVAAHTGLREYLDEGGDNAYIMLYTALEQPLARIELSNPCGTVDEETGILTFDWPGGDEPYMSGSPAYGVLFAASDEPVCRIPVAQGVSPHPGYLMINSALLFANEPIDLISATLG